MLDHLPLEIKNYYLNHPKEVQERMLIIRKTALELLGDCTECISYGIPTFKKKKNVFHYGAFKHHIGLYPGSKGVEFFVSQFSHYSTSKGCIQVQHQEEIQLSDIIELIKWCHKNYSQI
jgi:uncharacterized protein YdhG (YjbR/CyaY superfamily)